MCGCAGAWVCGGEYVVYSVWYVGFQVCGVRCVGCGVQYAGVWCVVCGCAGVWDGAWVCSVNLTLPLPGLVFWARLLHPAGTLPI
jgi:hypothetical protein